MRRLSPSTVPETSPPSVSRSTTSPMSYCRSSTMKSPEIVSRTSVWAPNPSATPTMPALKTSGPRLTLNPRRTVRPTISHATTTTIPPASETTVVKRRRRRPSRSSPASLARRRYRRTYRPMTQLTPVLRGPERVVGWRGPLVRSCRGGRRVRAPAHRLLDPRRTQRREPHVRQADVDPAVRTDGRNAHHGPILRPALELHEAPSRTRLRNADLGEHLVGCERRLEERLEEVGRRDRPRSVRSLRDEVRVEREQHRREV